MGRAQARAVGPRGGDGGGAGVTPSQAGPLGLVPHIALSPWAGGRACALICRGSAPVPPPARLVAPRAGAQAPDALGPSGVASRRHLPRGGGLRPALALFQPGGIDGDLVRCQAVLVRDLPEA